MKISATTVMMPQLDLQNICQLLAGLGYQGVELRVRRLPPEQAAPLHLSPDNVFQRAEEIKATMAAHGLELPAFASNCEASDLEQVRLLAEGAEAVGCPAIRLRTKGYDGTVSYHELYKEAVLQYRKALEITGSHGIRVLVEMHGHTIHPSASLAHRLVSNFSPKDIGVIYDPQNMVQDGFETIQLALELLGDYLGHVHAGGHRPLAGSAGEKGFISWTWPACPMSQGLYDYSELLRNLRKIGYSEFISVEDLRQDIASEERLEDGIAFLRALLQR